MYFKDLSNIKKISKSIERNGISIIKKFVDKKSIFETSKKVEGILNKPHLLKKADGYYVIWSVPLSVASHWAEWFYTSFEFPKLHIKQCHLVKNYFNPLNKFFIIEYISQ